MSSNENSDEEFGYQGYLLFNGIYKADFIDEEFQGGRTEARARLSDHLPEYDPDNQAYDDGYKRIRLDYAISDSESVENDLKDILNSLISYRYLYENRSTTNAYVDGELQQVEIPNINDADIIWSYPDFIFLRGAQEDVNETQEKTFQILSDHMHLTPFDFNGEFLLWLYYKHFEDQTISGGIGINELTDGEITGDRDPFGETNSVDDSTNLRQCIPIIVGILKDKSFSELEGYFDLYGDYNIKSKVSQEHRQGRVHVKASEGAISTSTSDVRRMALALNFVQALVELRLYWEELDRKEKFPPRDFFADLYETARNQDINIERISRDVLRKYANKRGEDPDDWLP